MSKPSQVIVVAEDDHQQRLIRRHLMSRGLRRHEMRFTSLSSGQGSGESWVRRKFVEETRAYRIRQARARTELVVMIDADTSTVQDRFNQLDQALRESGNEIVGDEEHIARLVAKRNVETWILCLNGRAVDEYIDYKRENNNWNELISAAADNLTKWSQLNGGPPDHCVSSLRIGIRELKRLI